MGNEMEISLVPIIIIAIVVIILCVLASCIKIVPQAHAFIVERLGGYQCTWSVGLHFKVPIIDKVARKVLLKEQVMDFPPQPVITKDNVTMQIDTVVFFQITDPKLFTYGVENPIMAIENLTATTLRNIIGDLELDQTLTSRETINTHMRSNLDIATDPWGIKVNRVELKNIIPPREKKEAMIREAEGKAQAIAEVQKATAEGLKYLNEAAPTESVLTLKSLEAFEKASDGQATKIIIPSEIQGIAGLAKSVIETCKEK